LNLLEYNRVSSGSRIKGQKIGVRGSADFFEGFGIRGRSKQVPESIRIWTNAAHQQSGVRRVSLHALKKFSVRMNNLRDEVSEEGGLFTLELFDLLVPSKFLSSNSS
jgi:hypothetical protein